MPFYSSHTEHGRLVNRLANLLDSKSLTSFALSKRAKVSPCTTRKIYEDPAYIPSPAVLEKICLSLECGPGDVLEIQSTIETSAAVGSGVFCC